MLKKSHKRLNAQAERAALEVVREALNRRSLPLHWRRIRAGALQRLLRER